MSNQTFSWPFPYSPRPNQVKAMEWLLSQTAKYLILEAPVGSGKSNIGLAYSSAISPNGHGDSFILTPQRILQEQYETSFRANEKVPLFSLYGRGNYQCHTKNASCEVGSLVKPRCTNCAHTLAKQAAKRTPNVVMNYKLALLNFGYTETFEPRTLMILDECHTLEHHLVDFDAVALTYGRAKKYELPWQVKTSLESARKWIAEAYLPKAKDVVKKLEAEVEYLIDRPSGESGLTQTELRKLKDFEAFSTHVDEVTEITLQELDYLTQHYVLVHDKVTMSFKRLKGAYTFRRILDNRASRMLFMSSTILNKDGFCYDLGIDPKDAAFLSLDSEFPVENRPVIYMPQMKMNAEWKNDDKEKERKRMLKTVSELLEMHKTESGIIHTANFQIAEWLVQNLEHKIPHRIHHHNPSGGDDRNSVINSFMTDPNPSVLISPSSTEGLDLKDDLGRFAIFVKVPFGYLGDQWIKRRMEMSLEWYQRRALIDVIQGGGRVVRGPEDKGNVYILDASWAYLYKQTFSMIPKWWREGYNTIA